MNANTDTFDFGNGPEPAYRHPNGEGWVADTAHASPSAYVGPRAQVFGNTRLHGNTKLYGKPTLAWMEDK